MDSKQAKRLLESHFWLQTVESDTAYRRQHDDTDGGTLGVLQVTFDRMGDAYVSIDKSEWLRFRTGGGGGASLRTRTALMLLAEAIRLDNAENDRSQSNVKAVPRSWPARPVR